MTHSLPISYSSVLCLLCLGISSRLMMVSKLMVSSSWHTHPSLGSVIPSVAFGTWTLGNGQMPISYVDQALSVGFSHIGED
jgi:hypothetical protein